MPSGAHHHHVGVDRVAHNALGERIGIECGQVPFADRAGDGSDAFVNAQVRVAPPHEIAGRHLGRIQERSGVVELVGDRCFGRGADDEVAADQDVGARLFDAHLVDVGRVIGDAQLA